MTSPQNLFDAARPITCSFMEGSWRGEELASGHPMDGALELSRWYGKRFDGKDAVHPLVFGTPGELFSVNPALMPMQLSQRVIPLLNKPIVKQLIKPIVGALTRTLIKAARTKRPRARLRMVEYRGVVSATMIYDALPINDHFRQLDDGSVIGAMDMRGRT